MNDACPAILVVDDRSNMLRLMTKVLRDVARVHTADDGTAALAVLDAEPVDVVLCDLKLPDLSGLDVLTASKARQPQARFILMTAYATVETAVAALKDGAFDYLTKPFDPEEAKATVLRALHSVRPRSGAAEGVEILPGMHARSRAMTELAAVVRQIAPTDIRVLIRGEPGAGKEMVARAIHRLSTSQDRPLFSLDCLGTQGRQLTDVIERFIPGPTPTSASTPSLGTLFIANMDALGASDQAELVGRLERLRAPPRAGPHSCRVIASTRRDLHGLVSEGFFRADLLLQIRVASLDVLPLRKRREDIPVLAAHLLAEVAPPEVAVAGFTASAMERLSSLAWPGNVAELRTVIEHAVALAGTGPIALESLPQWTRDESRLQAPLETLSWSDALARGRAEVARRYLVALLKRFDGDVLAAAAQADVERESFYRLLRRHGISADGFR
ncbi:MAG: sigma-54-dependent Fis family transcriptional regulator [Myxococcales bacterium]|jgi:two-component system response regulator HydG|nr:sigma-54-dependent Fis family transcriptional regulator [Myxococcales bacterium]